MLLSQLPASPHAASLAARAIDNEQLLGQRRAVLPSAAFLMMFGSLILLLAGGALAWQFIRRQPRPPGEQESMDVVNPLAVRVMGANINRRTLDNIRAAGLKIVDVEQLSAFGFSRLIEAAP